VALADSAGLDGPVLNLPRHGGYILWIRGDAHPPLVDGRLCGDRDFQDALAIAATDPLGLDQLLDRYPFTHAILPVPRMENDPMATGLSRRLEWALVSYDDAGCLFVRWSRDPVLAQRAYRYLTPDYLAMTERIVRCRADSGLCRLLIADLERARASSPFHARATLWLAELALALGHGPEAVRYLEEAGRIAPGLPGLAIAQARAYDMVGDAAGARAAYRRGLAVPDDAEEAREMLNLISR
jgi:tetratricopeptide (TPR) repeat protein